MTITNYNTTCYNTTLKGEVQEGTVLGKVTYLIYFAK